MKIELIEAERDEDMQKQPKDKRLLWTKAALVEEIELQMRLLEGAARRATENHESGQQWREEADRREKRISALENQEANDQRRLDHARQEIAELKGWQARVREVERGFKDEPSEVGKVSTDDQPHRSRWVRHP